MFLRYLFFRDIDYLLMCLRKERFRGLGKERGLGVDEEFFMIQGSGILFLLVSIVIIIRVCDNYFVYWLRLLQLRLAQDGRVVVGVVEVGCGEVEIVWFRQILEWEYWVYRKLNVVKRRGKFFWLLLLCLVCGIK